MNCAASPLHHHHLTDRLASLFHSHPHSLGARAIVACISQANVLNMHYSSTYRLNLKAIQGVYVYPNLAYRAANADRVVVAFPTPGHSKLIAVNATNSGRGHLKDSWWLPAL
jgi:hypothetical protein